MENKLSLWVIYGKAGSGKTTRMIELIDKAKDYMVLAPTNAAVENIYTLACESLSKQPKRDRYKTVYSFFRIDYESGTILGAQYYPSTLFIDEFGLMDKNLFKKCVLNAERNGVTNMVICGDVLQLNPIYDGKQFISMNKLKRLNTQYANIVKRVNGSVSEVLYPSVVEHIHLNIFGMKLIRNAKLTPMTTNKRANDKIKTILSNVYAGNVEFDYKFVEFYDLDKLIVDDDYVFIASKYSILQQVYDLIYENKLKRMDAIVIEQSASLKTSYKRLYLIPGMRIITCETVKNSYINGEELIFTGNVEVQGLKCIQPLTNEVVYVRKAKDDFDNEFYPITPAYLLSVHKSQGRTIEKVIVCIDNMFEISMLYTAITRSKSELVFYSKEVRNERVGKLIESAFIPEFKQLNLMANYMYCK